MPAMHAGPHLPQRGRKERCEMAFPKLYGFNDAGLCMWEHQCSENDMGPGGPFIDGCNPHPLTKTIKVFGEFKFWQRCGSGLWCRVFAEAPSNHQNALVGKPEAISKIINHK